ncbi:MAG: hypothetical protein AAF950_17610 [Pseudomonadota bacterium]
MVSSNKATVSYPLYSTRLLAWLLLRVRGVQNIKELVAIVGDYDDHRLSDISRLVLTTVIDQLRDTAQKIDELKKRLHARHRTNDIC